MPFILLAVICGILSVSFLPVLPHPVWLLLVLPIGALRLVYSWRWLSIVLALGLGVSWGVGYGYFLLNTLLPEHLVGKELVVTGRIVDLPLDDERRQRFAFKVESANYGDRQILDSPIEYFPRNLQLSWYDGKAVVLSSGERWQLVVRLKKPRGFVNPGGFDYQAWLMRRGIGGVGYVRAHPLNQKLAEPAKWDISAWRFALRNWLLANTDSQYKGIMLALLIGDRALISPEQWRVMQLTGINHLISISGLHVGFIAILGFAVGLQLGKCVSLVCRRCSALLFGYGGAMLFAFVYSALAGFNIPTQRTLIMVLAIQLAFFLRRSYSSVQVFLLALLAVVLNDPLAAYDIGFWLSFGAVAVLLFCFAGRYASADERVNLRLVRQGRELLRSQWVIFIGLFLPLTLLINSLPLLAPIANLLAIPLVTFAVVPVLLLAAANHWWLPALSKILLVVAHYGLDFLYQWLELLLALGNNTMNPVISFNEWALMLAAISLVILLLPRGIITPWLGYAGLVIALLLPPSFAPPLSVTVLDVGQGLAVVVQTPNHRLLYDTGPAYSEKFEAGSAIIAPFLRQQGVDTLDALIVSHNDLDHAGGLSGLAQSLTIKKLWAGEPDKTAVDSTSGSTDDSVHNSKVPIEDCHQQPPWQWDEVRFRFLQTPISGRNNANNHSCVLLIEYAGQMLLLPGDIDSRQEANLLFSGRLPTRLTLVLAAHHGSRSSSSPSFVAHTYPQLVVYSAGYRNQHRHPHPDVVARYRAIHSRDFHTAQSGAIHFVWQAGVLQPVIEYRREQRRYWFD